jgi:hypothetical protein
MRKRPLSRVSYESSMCGTRDLRSNACDSETSRVQAARASQRCRIRNLPTVAVGVETLLRVRWTIPNRRMHNASAAVRPITGKHSDGNHSTNEEDIKDDSKEREERLATEEACEKHGEDGVENCSARKTSDCLEPCADHKVSVGQDRQEVAIDAQDDTGAAELDRIEDGLKQLESSAAECHLGD